jgi:hypothetical protein
MCNLSLCLNREKKVGNKNMKRINKKKGGRDKYRNQRLSIYGSTALVDLGLFSVS